MTLKPNIIPPAGKEFAYLAIPVVKHDEIRGQEKFIHHQKWKNPRRHKS